MNKSMLPLFMIIASTMNRCKSWIRFDKNSNDRNPAIYFPKRKKPKGRTK